MIRTKLTVQEAEAKVFYFMEGNNLLATIYVSDGWKLMGEVNDVVNFPYRCLIPIGSDFNLDQDDCEYIIRKRIRPNRGYKDYDEIKELGARRGANTLDNYWFAWSLQDRAEDWHPRFNKELMDKFHPDIDAMTYEEREKFLKSL